MNPKIGIGVTNGAGDIADLLEVGFGTYLVVHGGHSAGQVKQIRERYPDSRIYLRRFGSIGGSPVELAREMRDLFQNYSQWGIVDLIAWNEPDRVEEGGFSSQQIADFAGAFLAEARRICPAARLHWPALAHLPRYQGSEPEIWLPVARQFDVINFHAYHDPGNARAFFQWISTFIPGRPIACTEYNWGPGNARPPSYGDWLFEVYRQAVEDFPAAEAICPFIWEWIHPEPGIGTTLDIKRDADAREGVRRAISELTAPAGEQNPATDTKRPEVPWAPEVAADGNDCFAASIVASGTRRWPDFPSLQDFKRVYRGLHPGWNDQREVPRLDLAFVAFQQLDVQLDSIHEQPAPWQAVSELTERGLFPTVWIWMWGWNPQSQQNEWFKHAVVILRRVQDVAGEYFLSLYDPQRLAAQGAWFSVREREFLQGQGEIQFEGHIYQPTYRRQRGEQSMSNQERFEPIARRLAQEHRVDADIFCRQIQQESNWNPNAVSPSGAEGLGQLIPKFYPNVNRFDPEANLTAAAQTMRSYLDRFDGDYASALAAYNGGPVAMERWIREFGPAWRTMLTRHSDRWPAVAGYGTAGKAREVALYLDKILGPEQAKPNQETKVVKPPDGIKWVGSPNFSQGRDGHRPVAIVNHIMEGTLAACDSWFNSRESQVSAHFGVGKNGELHQYVRTTDTAWANGRANRPDFSVEWIADAVRRNVNPNALTVSIEHEGRSGDVMPEAQYQATLALHRYLIAEYGVPVDRSHIAGHFHIDAVNRSRCPGTGFPWDRLLSDLGGPTKVTKVEKVDQPPKEVVKVPEGLRWIGSPNFTPEREGHHPVAIVFHTLEDTLEACDQKFSSPDAKLSVHFAIGKQGAKHQYVRSADTAWANGVVKKSDRSIHWLADAVAGKINPNLLTVSIGLEGKADEEITDKQYAAAFELITYLVDLYDLPADQDRFIGHNQIDSVDSAACPGPQFPWDRLRADLAVVQPKEPELTDSQALDEIWRIAQLLEASQPAEADTLRRMVTVLKE